MQSLLQGLPISAQSYSYPQASMIEQMVEAAGGADKLMAILFPSETPAASGG